MHKSPQDWHPEDIKCAIRKTNVTLTALAVKLGHHPGAVRKALLKRYPAVEASIAAYLGLSPQQIWPSRYDELGNSKTRPYGVGGRRSPAPRTKHGQNHKAA